MARWKTFQTWVLVLVLVVLSPSVYSRPSLETTAPTISSSSSTNAIKQNTEKLTENPTRVTGFKSTTLQQNSPTTEAVSNDDGSRVVKSKTPVIGESIKVVAHQLLQSSSNITSEAAIVEDTRIPPKLKNQLAHKHKLKTRQEDVEVKIENSHAGIAVPVTMEELETENKISDISNESSTSNEGISTWILLSNSPNIDNTSVPTEPTKVEETVKKTKPIASKNKTKRPPQSKPKRPIIGSMNKSDLIAGGSAINENVLNKLKDTVLSNVQKNKHASNNRTTTTTSTSTPATINLTVKKEATTKSPSTVGSISKVTSKVVKKKNKIKQKVSTTAIPIVEDSALLPMEAKEQEIELEVSTPATTTKKPKRSTNKRKKNKTKKRKTPKPVVDDESENLETKNSTKTKVSKLSKKPNPISTQIYNYLSREVMPSVGVGIVGLAGLVGLASYFLYPFASPVRRTYEVDKKDDLYRHNAEEYANEGNGQAEEEMLGTVLAGMPSHSKHKLNPYVNQTPNRYSTKQEPEQNLRYRHVTSNYDTSNYNPHYPQQKTGIAHAAVYSQIDPVNYNTKYETHHVYSPDAKYAYNNDNTNSYTPYPAVEPIYAAPQTGPTGISSYGSDTGNSVVYGVKPGQDTDFKPVYPFEGQVFTEATDNPMPYPSTSMYLGSNNESGQSDELKYSESIKGNIDNKFVVGNVPKELVDSATPAIVPEHGPRKLTRKRRNIGKYKRSLTGSLEDIIRAAKEKNKDIFISNEIDGPLLGVTDNKMDITITPMMTSTPSEKTPESKKKTVNNTIPVYTVYSTAVTEEKKSTSDDSLSSSTIKTEIIESVSTQPFNTQSPTKEATEAEITNAPETTTTSFKIYEVFRSSTPSSIAINEQSEPLKLSEQLSTDTYNLESTTEFKNVTIEINNDSKSEFTSTSIPPSETKGPSEPTITITSTKKPKPLYDPTIITYPPYNEEGSFITFLKRLIEFKYRLGLSILQTTSDSLNRYLRSMGNTVNKVAKASQDEA